MRLADATITEASIAIAAILAALSVCCSRVLAQLEQSRCSRLDCLCCHVERDTTQPVIDVVAEEV